MRIISRIHFGIFFILFVNERVLKFKKRVLFVVIGMWLGNEHVKTCK